MAINGTVITLPSAPAWLSESAQKEWRRVQPFLEERQVLTDVDISNLENYCVAQGRVRECEADIQGVTDIDIKSKLWRMQNQAMTVAKQIGAELGLTPMSRSRPMMRDLFDDEAGDDPLHIS
ncbi:phage terminase small subunit P27 family [Devosia rhodophyticola]|uniref:Phage terminase small subunit P27 family n=1 Tax=Devosia rhodophyticola TaxID=3026423 RepID=A0ABY7Z175_9HYPH|nr:phage terminase small subunit P27 family [Devosia rhodophyticola]WDR07297.1 phage terminase small subunit P27 family [Devosia rhodophyticola]